MRELHSHPCLQRAITDRPGTPFASPIITAPSGPIVHPQALPPQFRQLVQGLDKWYQAPRSHRVLTTFWSKKVVGERRRCWDSLSGA